jgi:hypothetical protein
LEGGEDFDGLCGPMEEMATVARHIFQKELAGLKIPVIFVRI